MSKEYVIMTDSSCDLPQELADQLGLEVLPLEVMAEELSQLAGRTGDRL